MMIVFNIYLFYLVSYNDQVFFVSQDTEAAADTGLNTRWNGISWI